MFKRGHAGPSSQPLKNSAGLACQAGAHPTSLCYTNEHVGQSLSSPWRLWFSVVRGCCGFAPLVPPSKGFVAGPSQALLLCVCLEKQHYLNISIVLDWTRIRRLLLVGALRSPCSTQQPNSKQGSFLFFPEGRLAWGRHKEVVLFWPMSPI